MCIVFNATSPSDVWTLLMALDGPLKISNVDAEVIQAKVKSFHKQESICLMGRIYQEPV